MTLSPDEPKQQRSNATKQQRGSMLAKCLKGLGDFEEAQQQQM